ncbi:MAG: hypothetical protein H5U20_07065 [Rhodobacteraceae bacterium]|nr:hypothetical protein [Paracoccaceae bacterium]
MLDAAIEKILSATSPGVIDYKGIPIPVSYRKGTSDALIVLFHGVIRRDIRRFPCYEAFLPVTAHQISIADPALLANEEIVSSWYLGLEGTDQPALISELVQGLAQHLGSRKTIYMGGSAGGFAALLYSRLHPGSLAIAVSPQTQLQTYQNRYVEVFRSSCWPSAAAPDDIALSDLGRVYRQGFDNTAVLVMSAGDFGHIYTQFIPFVQNIPLSRREQFVIDIGYWNVRGHPGSVPRTRYTSWIRAALFSPTLNASDLLDTHYRATDTGPSATPDAKAATAPAPTGPDPADIRRADLLRDLELKS